MNLTDTVTITSRSAGTIDQTTGLPNISPVVEYDNLRCSFVLLTASEHSHQWGDASQPTDYTKSYAHVVLPEWVPELPEAGKKLADYTFTVDGRDYLPEAVKRWPHWQSVLASRKL